MVVSKIKLRNGVIVSQASSTSGVYVQFDGRRFFLTQTELENMTLARFGNKDASEFIRSQFK